MISNHRVKVVLTGLVASTTCLFFSVQSSADTIAILGTGNVGSSLGPQFAELGHTIVYGSRDPSAEEVQQLVAITHDTASATNNIEAAAQADIVVLAIPAWATEELVKSLGDLSGKIIIDPTNPLMQSEGGFARSVDTSAGEMIQEWAPEAFVVKAFNTLGADTMADASKAGGPITIPLAGNNATAKAKVADLVEGIGFEAVDMGPIQYAHEIEGLLVLWINARNAGERFDYYLRPLENDL